MLKRRLKALLFCLIVASSTISLYAQNVKPINTKGHYIDVNIYFPYDQSYIDPDYMGNEHTLATIDSLLSDSEYTSTLRRIEVKAQSSPEGTIRYNTALSERRRLSLQKYFLEKYPNIKDYIWSFTAVAENWDLFRKHLIEDKNLPESDRIMTIVDGTRELDAKEWLLKTMDNGKPWLYIKEHILPRQRLGASILFIPVAYCPMIEPQKVNNSIFNKEQPTTASNSRTMLESYSYLQQSDPKILFAIRSNLVLDAASVINLAVEVPIGKRISLAAEIVQPWWRNWASNFTMQIESYHGELKYWLGDRSNREQLTGWSVGLYGGWGRYDIQPFTKEGVQGYFWDAGAMLGYSLPLSDYFNLEFNLGLGYVDTEYKDYYIARDTEEYGDIKVIPYPWLTNSLKAVLPTRGGISLVWTIKNKGGHK